MEQDRKESNERGDFGSLYSGIFEKCCSFVNFGKLWCNILKISFIEKELMRMAELKRIAAMGTSDEQLIHTLIAR